MPNSKRLPRNWPWLRQQALERDNYQCRACGSRHRLEVDHVARGDDHSLANLQVLCRHCHINKTAAENRRHVVTGQRDWEAAMSKGRNRFARLP